MDRILILDDMTINQIAAGEVVERPASIIKELVENSIDAGASAITIEIRDGGTSFIRVTDNGKGMSPTDARISFNRHATSKIESSKDLNSIVTLGFRGEALASIAAVTHMEMITREQDSMSGIHIINHGGHIVEDKETGCPEGTTIIARNIFYNTPARLKFLKSIRTETAYISDIVGRFILAQPDVSFKYINNGKLIYYSPGDRELKHAVLSVYGKDVIDQILPLEPIDTAIGVKLWGLVGKPSLSRKNRSHQSFFVNRRYVKSKLLEESVAAAYKPYLTINQFPWIVLHIDIEPNKIDVNVHPAKTEIRFRDEDEIGQIIQYNIGAALEENPYIPTIKEDTFITFDTNGVDGDKSQQLEVFPTIPIDWDRDKDEKNEYTRNIYASKYSEAKDYSYDTGRNPGYDYDNVISNVPIPLKVIGTIFATYILVEGNKQCFLIDQHAAHERIVYERYKKMLENQAVVTQQLLPPLVIEVTHTEQIIINESMDVFQNLGFDIENFGGRAFAIRGVPVILGSSNPREFFEELLYGAKELDQGSNYKLRTDDIIRMSCKKAIKSGDKLSDMEIVALLRDLMEKRIPMTCPHGRPIMISLTRTELEKMFKRIQ
ncbi:MAG: DNA mismatch repair endonuclease MutL [Clostridiales bacterium]|jgi:DNA mismatch repair protein MutL|nr:DNA mismatch repair endonuclease MutL [Clostridiales bacterium]